jgi:hypothetical protein
VADPWSHGGYEPRPRTHALVGSDSSGTGPTASHFTTTNTLFELPRVAAAPCTSEIGIQLAIERNVLGQTGRFAAGIPCQLDEAGLLQHLEHRPERHRAHIMVRYRDGLQGLQVE